MILRMHAIIRRELVLKKISRMIMAGMLSMAMVMGVSTITAPEVSAAKVNVKKVSVTAPSGKTLYVAKGKSVKLSTEVKVTPNKKANKKVKYVSSNPGIAKVSAKGVVKGVKAGKTNITVTSEKAQNKKATIKVVVKNKAVKTVSIEKCNSINVGESVQLKAKVTPTRKASGILAWSSSNNKVATVSSKGKVTAKKVGETTITAKATDGSGKKATCKINVENAVNIAAMEILNQQTITFSLDKELALTPAQIEVFNKVNADGTYNRKLSIDSMTTGDNKNYSITVNYSDRISKNTYVQVSIPSLSGTVKSMEKRYSEPKAAYTSEEISVWEVGEYSLKSFSFKEYGYSSYSVAGLPAGLSYEVKNREVYIKGTPTAAGKAFATISASDEYGNTMTKSITIIVSSKTQMFGAAKPVYAVLSATEGAVVYQTIQCVGGSNEYTYSVISDGGTGATIEDAYDNFAIIKASVKVAGVYTITVRAADKQNSNLYCDIPAVINAVDGINIAGVVKDATGNPIEGARIVFSNNNRADRYTASLHAYTDEKGQYSVNVASGVYDIKTSYHDGIGDETIENYSQYAECAKAVDYKYSETLNAAKSGFDITLPLYKVTLLPGNANDNKSDSEAGAEYESIRWEHNCEYVGTGSKLYLKAGNYNLKSLHDYNEVIDVQDTHDWFNGGYLEETVIKYMYSTAFNVVNAPVQATVHKSIYDKMPPRVNKYEYTAAKNTTYTAAEDIAYDLLKTTTTGYYNDRYMAYQFAPQETGKYSISNESIYFYNEKGERIGNSDVELTAEKTYFVGTGSGAYDSNSDYSFKITKTTSPEK